MKKYFILFFVVSGLAFALYVISDPLNAAPPTPSITTADGKKITAMRGSYCWRNKSTGVCADSDAPPAIIAHYQTMPITVASEDEIHIRFSKPPIESGVNQWTNDNDAVATQMSGDLFTAPKQQGVYIYDVYAHWEQGSASYAFVIEVQ